MLLRSRAIWIAEGEKITKHFCSLDKRNYVSKRMSKLTLNNGQIISEPDDIIKEVQAFYQNLYTERAVEYCEISDMVEDIPTVNVEERNSLEGEISLEEASFALKNKKNDESPGSDGFTVEFFKTFWLQIGPLLLRSLMKDLGSKNCPLALHRKRLL